MASVVVDQFHLLERSMFSQVLNIYVAGSTAGFAAASLALLGTDTLCDFGVVLLRRPAGGSFVAHNSDHRAWDFSFVQRQATLLRSIRREVAPEQMVLVGDSPAHESLGRYRSEILELIGSHHAVLLFVGEPDDPPSLLISVHRGGGSPDFDPVDLARLDAFRRYIENAWTLLNQRLLARVLLDGISLAVRNYAVGVVMLDSHFRIVWHNRAARAAVHDWREDGGSALKPGRTLGPLPADILAACARRRAEWLESPSEAHLRRRHLVRHPTIPGRCATVRLCGARFNGIASPCFVVQFEQDAHPAIATTKSSLLHSLTSTEREVARLVCQGMSNQEIADALGKSVDAVKFHLHRMFKKAAVTTRSRLMLALSSTG